MQINKIIVTTDFSPASTKAFQSARIFAEKFHAELELIYAAELWTAPYYLIPEIPNPENITEYNKSAILEATTALNKLLTENFSGLTKVKATVLEAKDSAAQAILNYAKSQNCSLIVIASGGRGKISNMLLGSVVSKIVANTHCPVLSIPV